MRALADAVVYAVTYLNLVEDEREELLDDDVGAALGGVRGRGEVDVTVCIGQA